jgi:hypothetical protein
MNVRRTNSTKALISTIAGFSALGFFIMALVYWAVLATPTFSFNISQWDWTLRTLVIATIISFSIFLLVSPEAIGQAATRRSTRLTANAFVASLIAVAIAIVVNVIVEGVPTARADLTADQQFTLSEQTKKVLRSLDEQNRSVNVLVFANPTSAQSRQEAEDLLKEYRAHTSRLSYEFVDAIRERARAAQYGVNRLDVAVFVEGTKREIANSYTEREFTSALVRLGQTKPKRVAFLTGHGERDPNGFDQFAYGQVRQSLQDNNYVTLSWSLVTSPTLTLEQADVIVIAAPMRPYTDKELQAVKSYLENGGHALILLDPAMPANVLQQMANLLAPYGVVPVHGAVVDLNSNLSPQEPTFLYVTTYPGSEITTDFSQNNLPTGFPLSLGLNISTTVTTYTISPVVRTSTGIPQSWLETEPNSQVWQYTEGKDVAGPVNIAVSIAPADASTPVTDTTKPRTRIVVFGDADFAANLFVSEQFPLLNTDLFGNAVSWLAGANELVSIRPKDPGTPRTISLSTGERGMVFVTTVLGLPLLVLLIGAYNWWRRR